MVAVPVMKLFSLTVKTLAKPVAKRIKSEGERHPSVRGILNRMGQATNNLSARVSIRMAGHTTTKIKPLEEDKAVAAGGDLLAEGFIYGLGTFLMVWEYVSSAREKEDKEVASKLKKMAEQQELNDALEEIRQRLSNLEEAANKPSKGNTSVQQEAGQQHQHADPADGVANSSSAADHPQGGDAQPPPLISSLWRLPGNVSSRWWGGKNEGGIGQGSSSSNSSSGGSGDSLGGESVTRDARGGDAQVRSIGSGDSSSGEGRGSSWGADVGSLDRSSEQAEERSEFGRELEDRGRPQGGRDEKGRQRSDDSQ